MVVVCSACGKKYRVEPRMVGGKTGFINCSACNHGIMFRNPISRGYKSENSPKQFQVQLDEKTDEDADFASVSVKPVERRRVNMQWRRFLLDESLISRIILLAMCVSLIPLLGMSLFALHLNQKYVESSIEKLGSEMTVSLLKPVDEWLDKNVDVLQSAAKTPEIQSLDRKLQEQVLRKIHDGFPWMNAVFTGNICGENMARSDYGELLDYSEQSFYQDVMKGKPVAMHTFIDRATKRLNMVIAVPIKRGSEIVGYTGAGMGTDKLSDMVNMWGNGPSRFAFLVDENNKILAHPDQNYVSREMNMKNHPLIAAYKGDQAWKTQFFEENNEKVVGNVRKSKYGWKIAIQQPEKEALATHGRTTLLIALSFLITAGIVFFVSFLAGRAVIRNLEMRLNQIHAGTGIAG